MATNHTQPALWPPGTSPSLSSDQVWHVFFLNALLRDSAKCGVTLVLPDQGDQNVCLHREMELGTKCILKHGQPHKMHTCSVCEKFIPGSGYAGLSKFIYVFIIIWLLSEIIMQNHVEWLSWMGHPSFKMHNCTYELITNWHHFCAHHNKKYSTWCVITDCNATVKNGHCTCSIPEHCEMELQCNTKG